MNEAHSMAWRRKLRWLAIYLAWGALFGCGASTAQNDQASKPKPGIEELRRALNASYVSAKGARQECLGRWVFDVPRGMQWGINAPNTFFGEDRFGFTREIHGDVEKVGLANMSIMVLAPAKSTVTGELQHSVNARKKIGIFEYQEKIEVKKGRVEDAEELLRDPSKNVNNEDLSGLPEHIKSIKQEIRDIETRIANIQADWHPIDLGIPDSKGYQAGPHLYAFIYRDGRVYQFQAGPDRHEQPFVEREKAFYATIKRFRPRKLHEIPKEPGICIPYGFIADAGDTVFDIKLSLRFADRPGVIYTLGTGVIGEYRNSSAEPTLIKASARAAAGALSGYGGKVNKSIGPRGARIGELSADQGGISFNVADPGKPPVYNYSAYTGYGGWHSSQVLPYITVDMRSFTKQQDKSLKSDPPPFEESLVRLDELLKSIRLRSTEPVMPELRAIAGTINP